MKIGIFLCGLIFLTSAQAGQVAPVAFDLATPRSELYLLKELVLPAEVENISYHPLSLPPARKHMTLLEPFSGVPSSGFGKGIGNILYNPHYKVELK